MLFESAKHVKYLPSTDLLIFLLMALVAYPLLVFLFGALVDIVTEHFKEEKE